MNQDISASRQKALAEVTKRFTDAVRENQTATDLFDEALSQFLGINRTDGRCLDIIDRLGRVSAGQLAIDAAQARDGEALVRREPVATFTVGDDGVEIEWAQQTDG